MSRFKTIGISVLVTVFFFGFGTLSHAQTSTSSIAEQISELLQQVTSLQAQLEELRTRQSDLQQELHETLQLTRSLSVGMSGDDVEELQELLASDPEIYPEGLVTGYFGPLTARAVERLQERFGIEQVGVVGPVTRNTINHIFGNLNKGRGSLNRGPGNIFDRFEVDDDDEDDVDTSEFTPGTTGILVCHTPPGNHAVAHTIAIGGPAVQAHLRHGDSLGACDTTSDDDDDDDEDDDSDEDEDDETAPVISDIEVDVSSTTEVTVTWETDEESDSTVWYSTESDFEVDEDGVEEEDDSDEVLSHSIELSDLTASTTYYFIVGSEDDEGNLGMSSIESFETL